MHVDYSKLFDTPDELVEFLMKSNEEQDRILMELIGGKDKPGLELSCKVSRRSAGK